jgi:transcriptional regulator with XRE-family HTH domain
MLRQGVTTADLSRKTGLSFSAISKFRRGILEPSQESRAKIEDALGHVRIWSSPSKFKQRAAFRLIEERVRELMTSEGVSEETAREIVNSRLPALTS